MAKFQATPIPLVVGAAVAIIIGGGLRWAVSFITSMMWDPWERPGFATTWIVSGALGIVASAITFPTFIPLMRMASNTSKGKAADFADIADGTNLGPAAITAVLVGLITGIGYMLCFIPGVIAAVMLWPAMYVALEEGASPTDSIKRSIELSKNINLSGGNFLAALVAGLGIFACCVGIFATFPIGMLASAHLYRSARNEPVAS